MPNKKYKCYCGHEFKQWVYYSQGETSALDARKGKKSSLSTQVRCPKCLTLLPTWERVKVGERWIKVRR